MPEARHNLAQATVYLARAPKSNASYVALGRAIKDVRERGNLLPPAALRSASLSGRPSSSAAGVGYVYPHDDPAGFDVDCLPEELQGTRVLRAVRERRRAAARAPALR